MSTIKGPTHGQRTTLCKDWHIKHLGELLTFGDRQDSLTRPPTGTCKQTLELLVSIVVVNDMQHDREQIKPQPQISLTSICKQKPTHIVKSSQHMQCILIAVHLLVSGCMAQNRSIPTLVRLLQIIKGMNAGS